MACVQNGQNASRLCKLAVIRVVDRCDERYRKALRNSSTAAATLS